MWTDAEAEAPIIWPLDAKSQLIGKDPDAGKDWGQKKKGATEDEVIWWINQWLINDLLNGLEFEQTLGDTKDREGWHAAVHGVIDTDTT